MARLRCVRRVRAGRRPFVGLGGLGSPFGGGRRGRAENGIRRWLLRDAVLGEVGMLIRSLVVVGRAVLEDVGKVAW